jgi:uncharacterized protein
MNDYERDYPDYTATPGYEHGDEPPCNTSKNPNFYEVMDGHVRRRSFLVGGLATISTGLFGASLAGKAALAQSTAKGALLGFEAVPISYDDTVVVPEGYSFQVLGAVGEPIMGDMPAYRAGANSRWPLGGGERSAQPPHHRRHADGDRGPVRGPRWSAPSTARTARGCAAR